MHLDLVFSLFYRMPVLQQIQCQLIRPSVKVYITPYIILAEHNSDYSLLLGIGV